MLAFRLATRQVRAGVGLRQGCLVAPMLFRWALRVQDGSTRNVDQRRPQSPARHLNCVSRLMGGRHLGVRQHTTRVGSHVAGPRPRSQTQQGTYPLGEVRLRAVLGPRPCFALSRACTGQNGAAFDRNMSERPGELCTVRETLRPGVDMRLEKVLVGIPYKTTFLGGKRMPHVVVYPVPATALPRGDGRIAILRQLAQCSCAWPRQFWLCGRSQAKTLLRSLGNGKVRVNETARVPRSDSALATSRWRWRGHLARLSTHDTDRLLALLLSWRDASCRETIRGLPLA